MQDVHYFFIVNYYHVKQALEALILNKRYITVLLNKLKKIFNVEYTHFDDKMKAAKGL